MQVGPRHGGLLAALVLTAASWLLPIGPAHADDGKSPPTISEPSTGTYEGRIRISGRDHHTKKKDGDGTHKSSKTLTKKSTLTAKQLKAAYLVMCREAKEAGRPCEWIAPEKGKAEPAKMIIDLDGIARTLVSRIRIPSPAPQVGPDPSANEWKMAAVGYPLWLWSSGPSSVVDRVRAYGVTFTLRADWTSSRFSMGDGRSVSCTATKAWSQSVKPGAASPVCGYTYQTSSLPRGEYTLTSTTYWRITWSALGLSGAFPASFTGSRSLAVGELDALVVK
ncbi:MAG: hypothetical protein QM779_00505 [Propionicimonas sp.]|uniref:hypothetical protein n=1 Tax=Propionicimonas sp. TaxID=1955623 RepID=UPI003D12CD11